MKRALVLGGTEDHIYLLEILKREGFNTVLVDYYANPPARDYSDIHVRESTLDFNRVLCLATKFEVDLVITACIDQALLTMAYVNDKLHLPCHLSLEQALQLTNKASMKSIFKENGIPTSRFIILNDINANVEIDLKFPVVIKPVDANGSKGISKVISKQDIGDAIANAFSFSRSKSVIIEEYVDGDEFSVDLVIKESKPEIVLVTKNIKAIKNNDKFTIVQNVYPAVSDAKILDRIKEIAKKIAVCYNLRNSPLLIQMIFDGQNLSVVEFSARIGGGSKHYFIRKMTGFDILNWYVGLIIRKANDINFRKNYSIGSVNYIYSKNGILGGFVGFEELKKKEIIDYFLLYKTVGMEIHNHCSSNDRVAGYMIVDNDINMYNSRLEEAKRSIKVLDEFGENIILHL